MVRCSPGRLRADLNRGVGSGSTRYIILGDPASDFSENGDYTAATPFAVARDILDAGLNMDLVWADDCLGVDLTWTTPIGCPVLLSGETSAFVVACRPIFHTSRYLAPQPKWQNVPGRTTSGAEEHPPRPHAEGGVSNGL